MFQDSVQRVFRYSEAAKAIQRQNAPIASVQRREAYDKITCSQKESLGKSRAWARVRPACDGQHGRHGSKVRKSRTGPLPDFAAITRQHEMRSNHSDIRYSLYITKRAGGDIQGFAGMAKRKGTGTSPINADHRKTKGPFCLALIRRTTVKLVDGIRIRPLRLCAAFHALLR